MTSHNKEEAGVLHTKKEMKKAVADKLQSSLPEMKTALGEKKFSRRLKKAVKMLIQGIHNNDVLKKAKKKADDKRAASMEKANAKKTKKVTKVKPAKQELPAMFI